MSRQLEFDFDEYNEIDDEEYWEQQPQIVIPNYSDYVVYPQQGLIFSLKTNKWVGNKNKKTGYWHCTLTSDEGKIWKTTLHRAIWIACNGNIPNGLELNHIDEDKSNNSISNLNLMTCKENINYGSANERRAKAMKGNTNGKALKGKFVNRKDLSKQVAAYKNGTLIMTFPSTREAGRTGYHSGAISNCCNGKQQSYKGYQWQYIN